MAADIVLEAMKGRVRVSESLSSVATWIPSGNKTNYHITIPNKDDPTTPPIPVEPHLGVPRPDKSGSWLAFLSAFPITGLLGIDHIWLRSPGTGILKLLSNAIVPGLWYIWDILQVFNEWERVKLYGLNAPFDTITGIAQGVLYDGWTNEYAQSMNFGLWMFGVFFGFMGLDCFIMGKFWLGMRKLFITIFTIACVVPLFYSNWSFFTLILVFFLLPEIIGLVAAWASDLINVLGNPAKVISTGLKPPSLAYDAFAFFIKMYEDKPNTCPEDLKLELEKLKQHYMFKKEGITAAEMKSYFWIAHGAESAASEGKGKDTIPPGFPPLTLAVRACSIVVKWVWDAVKAAGTAAFKASPAGRAAGGLALAGGAGGGLAALAGAGNPAAALAGAGDPAAALAAATPAGALAGAPAPPPGGGAATPAAGGAAAPPPPAVPTGGAVPKIDIQKISSGGSAGGAEALKLFKQGGGAYPEELSTEAQILGATVIALIAGGSLKGLVDYLMVQ
jgi:hypothetical protein